MGLTRYKLGELIEPVDERNTLGLTNFSGLNISKEFMPTTASTVNLDASKYKVVRKKRFVFSGMQTGRDKTIRISMYEGEEPIIVSPAYTTFEISRNDVVIPEYFFMLFKSPEMDRYGWFLSDSSIRSNLDWSVFCGIKLNLPPLEIQQKYVDIYNAMIANQKAYENSLHDLSVVSEAQMDQVKRTAPKQEIGKLLESIDRRNHDGKLHKVMGINISKQFMPSVAKVSQSTLLKYKVINSGEFGYSSMQTGRDETIRIAYNARQDSLLISPAYDVLRVKSSDVLAEYVMLWFSRSESDRYGWFASDASIRSNLDLSRFFEIEIPVPSLNIQKSIVGIYRAFLNAREISDRLKTDLKNLCPVLIKGSLDEAAREEAQL